VFPLCTFNRILGELFEIPVGGWAISEKIRYVSFTILNTQNSKIYLLLGVLKTAFPIGFIIERTPRGHSHFLATSFFHTFIIF